MSIVAPVLESRLASLTLDQALWWYRNGLMTSEEWTRYAHAWQTGAPRFEIRACACEACRTKYPSPEYRALSTGVAT